MYLQSLEEYFHIGNKTVLKFLREKTTWKTGLITSGAFLFFLIQLFIAFSLRNRIDALETNYTKLHDRLSIFPPPFETQRLEIELANLRTDLRKVEGQYVQLNQDHESVKLAINRLRQSQALIADNSERVRKMENAKHREVQKPVVTFEPKIEPQITLPAKPPKLTADIIVKSVSVYGTKENGGPWDDSGDPDLQVSISIDGYGKDFGVTNIKKNRTYASFEENIVTVEEGDTITVKVIDSDFTFDDEISTYSKKITKSTILAGSADWSFGRVRSLRLKFEP